MCIAKGKVLKLSIFVVDALLYGSV